MMIRRKRKERITTIKIKAIKTKHKTTLKRTKKEERNEEENVKKKKTGTIRSDL